MKVKKDKIKLKSQVKELEPLDSAITNVLFKYKDSNFVDIRNSLEIDFKKLFKQYKNYEYHGYTTQLGILDDIVIHYKEVK